ncbi:acyl-CoA dehydrogenase [Variovorax paradoxus]|uniref:Acyl-CoA dehydrogenase n=1 Tax=Variovorax paradoxus TaxID=34073 RepID=A0A5Q0M5S6_VARPD|nr:acyl-CoA dehydrogenase family protein [Variovorax paradoxus]QFZ85110.1 acyl-CoA dehydrogenase [Variovorax paradoxus]
MDLFLSEEEVAFRDEVRAFLDAELDPGLRRSERLNPCFIAHPSYGLLWQAKLARRGWAVPTWPTEHGGPAWTLTQRYIFDQECERRGEPRFRTQGIKMLAPVLMRYGTPAQKMHYLPRIISGEHVWAQGYSEPGAGSDLAALRTKAVRDGDDYVVNGSKIWASMAHESTHIFSLVRTADTGKKQEGITFLLMALDAPGITIRPIKSICGSHEFNEVFFDNVRVPVGNRVGEENSGWEVTKYLLEFERGGNPAGGMLRAWHGRLLRLASVPGPDGGRAIDDPVFATQFAEIGMDIDANDMIELTAMSKVQAGGNPGAIASSVMKLERSRIRQAISELAAMVVGMDAVRWETSRPLTDLPEAPQIEEERMMASAIYFNSRSQSLLGGSNEIQLEIIARDLLR